MSHSSHWIQPSHWRAMARAALAGLGLLVLACGGKDRESTGMGDTSRTSASADTSVAARGDSGPTAPVDTSHQAPAAKDSTPAPPAGGTPVARRADTSAKKKAAAPSAPAKQPVAQDTGTQTAGGELHDKYHPAPLDTVPQQVYNGWKQFNLNCARCHGEDVLGTTIAPHLIVSLKPDGPINTKELFISTVCSGRPQKGMPAWCSLGLGMDKIEDIYTYVKGRSDGKIHPGRPAVRQAG